MTEPNRSDTDFYFKTRSSFLMENFLRNIRLMLLVTSVCRSFGQFTDVRLVDGPAPNIGTVLITEDCQTWKTTCGTNLYITDAIVICRQLGYPSANRALSNTPYQGNYSTPMDDIGCNGGEASIGECLAYQFPSGCDTVGAAVCYESNYVGCFFDSPIDRILPGAQMISEDLTIERCIEFCRTQSGMVFAGVKRGDECYCGDVTSDLTKHGTGREYDCLSSCSGSDIESCGGIRSLAVFNLTTEIRPPRPPVAPICRASSSTSQPPYISTVKLINNASPSEDTNSLSGETVSNTLHPKIPSTLSTTSSHPAMECGSSQGTTLVIIVGALLGVATLYAIIVTGMLLHSRRSYNDLLKRDEIKSSELDPYTALDVASIHHPSAYMSVKAPDNSGKPLTRDVGATYENQNVVEQTARFQKPRLDMDHDLEPEYIDIAT